MGEIVILNVDKERSVLSWVYGMYQLPNSMGEMEPEGKSEQLQSKKQKIADFSVLPMTDNVDQLFLIPKADLLFPHNVSGLIYLNPKVYCKETTPFSKESPTFKDIKDQVQMPLSSFLAPSKSPVERESLSEVDDFSVSIAEELPPRTSPW